MGDMDVVAVVRAMGWDAVVASAPDVGDLAQRVALAGVEASVEAVLALCPVPVFVEEEISALVDATYYPATVRTSPLAGALQAACRR